MIEERIRHGIEIRSQGGEQFNKTKNKKGGDNEIKRQSSIDHRRFKWNWT